MGSVLYSLSYFSRVFGIEQDNPGLYRAQYLSMAKQTPLLFLIAISTTIGVSFINLNIAPNFLTIYFPASLLIGDLGFFLWFMRIPKNLSQELFDRQALIRLHATIWGSLALGISHAVWAISLFEFGDATMRGLETTFLGVSTLGVAICLMHIRAAAMAIIVSIIGPVVVYYWMTDLKGFHASAINLTLISAVFAVVLNSYARDFVRMIKQQQLVAAKIEEAESLSQANIALANEDSLTKLANRRSFLSNLNDHVHNVSLGQANGLAVGILDLDGFKQVNDVYGHPTGDQLLKEVGRRLRGLICNRVFIARLGGDEFGILVNGMLSDAELIEFGEIVCEEMRTPFDIDDLNVQMGGSVGFARWQSIDDIAENLFEKADYALYHTKGQSRGGVTIFNEKHAETIRAVSQIDRRMQDANFAEEMSLVYQPITSLTSSGTVGFEVLARWHSPTLGFVSPDVFIRSAERGGAINRLTAVLLTKALEEAKNWPDHLYMSFNLSMQDITSATAMLKLIAIINNSGFDPKRITFEVTETAVMSDRKMAKKSLTLLKHLGVKIALDDFGTGHSSLAYVRSLPLDKIKLDRSFIHDIEVEEDAGAIVDIMVEMCRSLRVDCIVEGVETQGQIGVLTAMGCEYIQGYYFSKPLSAKDTNAYIEAERQEANQEDQIAV